MTAVYRGETVRIVAWNASGTKAKIATARGLRWAQTSELEWEPPIERQIHADSESLSAFIAPVSAVERVLL